VPFVRWWAERKLDQILGLTAGPGLDEAAAAFSHVTIRDAGVGIDAWNAWERDVRRGSRGLVAAGGVPVRTFHFDDFDHRTPHLAVGVRADPPPLLLSANEALRELHLDYAARLADAAPNNKAHDKYGWGRLRGAIDVDAAIRLAVREALRQARLGRGDEPPDPFEPEGLRAFVAFLNEPVPASSNLYSRYVRALYRTWPGLDRVFPDVLSGDRRHFVHWLHRYARADAPISSVCELPDLPRRSWRREKGQGVNVAGYLGADLGLAVSARRTIASLDACGVPLQTVTYRRTLSRQSRTNTDDGPNALFPVTVACVTAEQFPLFHADMGDAFFRGRYTIGYWYWELEELPEDQFNALDLVDEIWVATHHVHAAISSHTSKPVLHMPIPLTGAAPSGRDRASFGLDDGYTFLYTFDFNSVLERKNPLGVVAAFRLAFPAEGSPRLVLKSINADLWPDQSELIRCAIADRADVTLIDGYLTEEDHAALLAACDCYVSLHRAEGLGLNLADAMVLGKPVIATGYSGNLDFMNANNSFLIPFRYVTVPPGTPAYPTGARWADPDLGAAAARMRELVAVPQSGRVAGERARRDLTSRWGPPQCGARMVERLKEVWSSGRLSRA
jgi:glycosyltransferase involved in cell wall biosynthesis